MFHYKTILLFLFALCSLSVVQKSKVVMPQQMANNFDDSTQQKLYVQYNAAIHYSDAAINSIAALNSLIKKENYRNKISSFNNPTSSDMGFNLQLEINSALKPLLEKAKNVNQNKFMDVVSSLVGNQSKTGVAKSILPTSGIFSTLTSLVGTLTINDKRLTKADLDSFMNGISKYFGQYEKLNRINQQFDISIDKVDLRLQELQTDLKDFILDLTIASNNSLQRSSLKQKSLEELLLKYLTIEAVSKQIVKEDDTYKSESRNNIYFPNDAIKTAKDINSTINKIFAEYQKIYTNNYNDIKGILKETKQLGKNINTQQIDNSLTELQDLFNDSKAADALTLRLSTLQERLKTLVATEKMK